MFRQSAIILVVFCALIVVAAALLPGCESSATAVPSPQTTFALPVTTATPTTTAVAPATQKPADPSTSTPPAAMNIKSEIIYFHRAQRCVTCLCFEKQIKFVVATYYEDAIKNGKMTFTVLNAQEPKNAAIVKKYEAIGTQLFVNTIVNGIEHIKDIQAVWEWNCRNDPDGFNRRVKIVFDRSLQGEY